MASAGCRHRGRRVGEAQPDHRGVRDRPEVIDEDAGVMLEGDELTVTGDWGAERKLPLRAAWLGLGSDAVAAKKPLDWDL